MSYQDEIQKLKQHLKTRTAIVTFLKNNGEVREMECTLAPYLLPETKNTGRKAPDDVTVVFDLEKNSWRSFRNASFMQAELL